MNRTLQEEKINTVILGEHLHSEILENGVEDVGLDIMIFRKSTP
jgi:hypothetical protein